jgi:hypothetical protein
MRDGSPLYSTEIPAATYHRFGEAELSEVIRAVHRIMSRRGLTHADYLLECRHGHDVVTISAIPRDPLTRPLSFDDRGLA